MDTREGRRRVVISGVRPEIDAGRFPVKRTVGERLAVEADAFADGHDAVRAVLRFRAEDEDGWRETPMEALPNDRWRGSLRIERLVPYRYTIRAWVDRFETWRRELAKRVEADQELGVELLVGAELVEAAVRRSSGEDRRLLRQAATVLRSGNDDAADAALDPALIEAMARNPDRRFVTTYRHELVVDVDRQRARFGSWYELFPRSAADDGERHGTFADVEKLLPQVAGTGFDVLYLPPIHPIGRTHRKGRNNAETAAADEPGSPWAIGGPEGGHTAVHPDLGTLKDFDRLVGSVAEHGLELALDLAYQCSPDHPWVREHPEWFRHRPDGTIRYAENPPKKYQDIYPIDFETEDWEALWEALKGVVDFWIGHGVRIFRVDNPHTKSFAFWEWLIGEVRREHPEVIFLSEAFTRPKVMYRLAKLGFSQSYTYFAWRTTKWELMEYFTELTQTEVAEYFRPNLWPNTPDILTEQLQVGGRAVFVQRLVLAATLGASYGIYGPAFDHMDHLAVAPGKEEYLDSEKYQLRAWDRDRPDSLAEVVARVNRIRRENPALQQDRTLRFHQVDNDQILAFSKRSEDGSNLILVVANLDPHHRQAGSLELPLDELGIEGERPFQVHDLLGETRFLWSGPRNYVELDPRVLPAHILRVRRRIRTEQDFEYFL